MTQDEIIEMAREAGFLTYADRSYILSPSHDVDYDLIGELKAFAKLIDAKATAREREACAKVCESGADAMHPTVEGHVMKNFGVSTHLAQAIRNRGDL